MYCLPIDNITAATPTPLLQVNENVPTVNDLNFYSNNSSPSSVTGVNADNSRIYGDIGESSDAGGLGIKLLERVYHFMNKNSLIGARVDEYMRAHFGFGLPESPVIGRQEVDCAITDVLATMNNEDTYLAEYAGKGIGSKSPNAENANDRPKVFHFQNEHPGYIINLLCVVPLGGYVQGTKIEPVERFDFYEAEWDSLGMEPMPMSSVAGRASVLRGESPATFGFVPRYFGLKIKNNLANGGFSQRSQRAQFLPYSLDRLFDEEDFRLDASGANLENVAEVSLVADETLRYIGLNEKYGNFDRIFYDASGRSDNFIIHIINDFEQWSPWKPISDSYDTFDEDVDDSAVQISKS